MRRSPVRAASRHALTTLRQTVIPEAFGPLEAAGRGTGCGRRAGVAAGTG